MTWEENMIDELNSDVASLEASLAETKRQLAEVTKERDQLRAMLNLADALRNKEREIVRYESPLTGRPVLYKGGA